MSSLHSALLLLLINLGLVWLLMAAPLGVRTIRIRRTFHRKSDKLWQAINPAGASADWNHGIISSQTLADRPGIVEQVHDHLDRKGQPIRRLLAVSPLDPMGEDAGRLGYTARVIDDSVLDTRFWQHFHERREILTASTGATLVVEQTDRYRGLAFFLFRYFALRRELNALEGWMETGQSTPNGIFERPAIQSALAVLSTLVLWPFFGLTRSGLMISTFLTMVIVLHELGHMAAYRTFGHRKVRMIFVPLLGGIAIGGRPYNSLFEVAVCALMGPGMSAFLVPILIACTEATTTGALPYALRGALLVFILILGGFNLLNLLPMYRFDGGQVLRQIFRSRGSLLAGSFGITSAILYVGWKIGLTTNALLASLAVFTLLSLIGFGSVKPKESLDEMSGSERMLVSFGLFAAVAIHAYAVVYSATLLF